MKNKSQSSYDSIAEMYHKLWADWYLVAALPSLELLFFSKVPKNGRVLDVCCGCGHVTQELIRREYSVTGVDVSTKLIALARRDWPKVDWRVQDARALSVGEGKFDAALSTFDSLNHLSSTEDLHLVFQGVHRSLRRGGLFVFDMNLEEAFLSDHRRWAAEVTNNYVSLIRGAYDSISKTARTELIWFVPTKSKDLWRRQRSVVEEHSFSQGEIVSGLEAAGFREIETAAAEETGMNAELGLGRLFISATA